MRDGTTVGLLMEGESKEVDGVTYQLTQMVTNRSQSTYQNVLTINQSLADLVGSTFTCSVENTLGTANDSHPLAITGELFCMNNGGQVNAFFASIYNYCRGKGLGLMLELGLGFSLGTLTQ